MESNCKGRYDLILLLAGEDDKFFPRSKKAMILLEKKIANYIFISGGYGGFAEKPLGNTDGDKSYLYLLRSGVPAKNLFLDKRSRETLGNIAFPAASSMPGTNNPNLAKDVNRIIIVTDKNHAPRTKQYAEKVMPKNKIDYISPDSSGLRENNFTTTAYNNSLLRRLRRIPDHDPEAIVKFLEKEHPFYGGIDWLNKSASKRQAALAIKCIRWYFS